MQMIGRWRMLALARFLREFFADDSESLITDSRTLMAGYRQQYKQSIAPIVYFRTHLRSINVIL